MLLMRLKKMENVFLSQIASINSISFIKSIKKFVFVEQTISEQSKKTFKILFRIVFIYNIITYYVIIFIYLTEWIAYWNTSDKILC